MQVTQTEKKYLAQVGKLFYSMQRRRLFLVEKLYKVEYGNKFKYEIAYLGDDSFTKKIYAIDFVNGLNTRFIEIESDEQYKKLLDQFHNTVLR
jgi:hypothetical protein